MLLRKSFILTILLTDSKYFQTVYFITVGMKNYVSVSCSGERSHTCFYLTLFCLHFFSRQVVN